MCSGTCIDFKAYDICAHTLAVAEMDRSLTEFVHCYKTTNQRPPNVDALIHMDLPPGRGSKKTKATQRRKGATNKKRKEVVESYTNTSPTDHSASNPASTLVRSSGNRGTEKEAEKTTTQKDSEEPQVCIYCKDHSQLIQGVMRESVISGFRSLKGFKFFCVIMLPTV